MTESQILPECKVKFEEMDGMKTSLFGSDSLGGIVGCLKKKVSKKTLLIIAVIFCGFIVAILTAWGGVKDRISDNTTSISVIQSELSHIKTTTDKIEENQINPGDLLEAFEGIIKEYALTELNPNIIDDIDGG